MKSIVNKLWVRLALAFGVVTVTAVVIAAFLANYQVSTDFRQFMMHNQVSATLEPLLINYYTDNGNTWDGVENVFENVRGQGGMGMGQGRGMQHGRPDFILADASGQVIYSGIESGPTRLNLRQLTGAVALQNRGQTIGYLVAGQSGQPQLTGAAQNFLNQINQSLIVAGLMAGVLGILMGVAIAWGLASPLRHLAVAARRISKGQFDQRVSIKGADEITDLANAFNEMAANLEQAETLRRNLVADVAHELRTPLSVVQGNLRAILDDVYPLEKEEIASIYDETLILNRLVQDLRDLTQAEAGQLSLNIQPAKLTPIIETSTDLFSELAREKEIGLRTALPSDLPNVLIDPDRTRQVLQNLLSNAIRHTPLKGTIEITAEPFPPHPRPPALLPNAFIRISVTDSGPGISPEEIPHVFDRFWRADRSRAREQGGSGLGLAIARQLVQAQAGQIGVESEGISGKGSCFWFTLPVAAQ